MGILFYISNTSYAALVIDRPSVAAQTCQSKCRDPRDMEIQSKTHSPELCILS